MAKKIETEVTTDSPYIVENAPKQSWVKTKRGKLVTSIVGGVIVLGATFAAGVQVGEHRGPEGVSQFGFGGGDRDHGFGGPDDHKGGFQVPNGQNGQNGAPNGQLPMQPGNGSNNGQTGTNG